MIRLSFILALILTLAINIRAQHTFSIVAIDTIISDMSGRILQRNNIDDTNTKIEFENNNLQTVIVSFINAYGDINSTTLVLGK